MVLRNAPEYEEVLRLGRLLVHRSEDQFGHHLVGAAEIDNRHVAEIEGDKLEIAFEKAGTKKVVARFVRAADDIPF